MVTSKFRKRKIKRTYETEDDIIFARCIFRTEHNPFYLRNEEHEGIVHHVNGLVNGNLANNAVAGNGAGGGGDDAGGEENVYQVYNAAGPDDLVRKSVFQEYLVERCNALAATIYFFEEEEEIPSVHSFETQKIITKSRREQENLPIDNASVCNAAREDIEKAEDDLKIYLKNLRRNMRSHIRQIFNQDRTIGRAIRKALEGFVEVTYPGFEALSSDEDSSDSDHEQPDPQF